MKGNAIGAGSFGVVNLAMNTSNGELFVVKSASSVMQLRALENEAKILKNLDSPHVVQCLGHELSKESNGEEKFNLFMEYMAGGSLSDICEKFGNVLDESVVRLYTKEILLGLDYLHQNGIVHCDLKCNNVLLGSNGNIKLADFGCAKRLADNRENVSWQTICGTPLWMAPEVLRNEKLDFASDIWSLGCTVIEMATGSPPWGKDISNPMAVVMKIACSNEFPAFPTNFSKEGLDFLDKCFQRDPKKRCTTQELLRHPFITGEKIEKVVVSSPASVLDVGLCESDYDSDGSDCSRESLSKIPFSTRQKKRQKRDGDMLFSSDNWITVRSA